MLTLTPSSCEAVLASACVSACIQNCCKARQNTKLSIKCAVLWVGPSRASAIQAPTFTIKYHPGCMTEFGQLFSC